MGFWTDIGNAIQHGIQGYQAPPGAPGQGEKSPGTGQGRGDTPGTQTPTPQAPNMIAPMTGPIIFPTSASAGATPAGGWNTPTGHLPQIPIGQPGYGMPLAPMSFESGGIVPHTGLYEVRGGEVIVPKKKVAKLHKGEKVLLPTRRPKAFEGQFVGGYQDGGIVDVGPGDTQESPPKPTVKQRFEAALKAFAARPRMQATAGGGGGGGSALGMSPGRPGEVPGVQPPPRYDMTAATTGAGAGGPAGAGGGGMFPQLPGAAAQQQTPGMHQGLPPAMPGQPGGPGSYYSGARLPPYQGSFSSGGERTQYIASNILGGIANGVIQYKQQQYDKTVNETQQEAMRQIQLSKERQQAQGAIQDQPGPGDPRAQGQANANMRPGQPGQPGQPPVPEMTNDELDTYYKLKRDPATQKQAEQFAKLIDRRNQKAMKNLEKAQTDPNSPQYRGYMMAQEQIKAQQDAAIKQQADAYESAAKIIKARADADKAYWQSTKYRQFANNDGQIDWGTGKTLGQGSPYYSAIQALGPWFTPNEEGTIKTGLTAAMLGDDKAIPEMIRSVYSQRQQDARPRVMTDGKSTWYVRWDDGRHGFVPMGQAQPGVAPGAEPLQPGQSILSPDGSPGTAEGAPGTPGASTPGGAAGAPPVSLPELKGDTASQQTSAAPPPVPAGYKPQYQTGPKVYKKEDIYAFDPSLGKTGQWRLTTPEEADKHGWNYQSKEITGAEIKNDRELSNRMADITKKTMRYQIAMNSQPLNRWESFLVSEALSKDPVLTHLLSYAGVPKDFTHQLEQSFAYNHLPQHAKDRVFAYMNAREAMLGYTRVLSGSARSNQVGLELNLDVLPPPLLNKDTANEGFAQFRENLPTIAQGLPMIPGVDNVNDILSGKIPLGKLERGLPGSTTVPGPTAGTPGAGGLPSVNIGGKVLVPRQDAQGNITFAPAGQ